ncbi:hypothetical protein DdX_21216 [Ditylenchus destructor]|uniref:Uncharacterized protein n=1 Tax=Ditylenchus destructor TaxID=166010 RepID=A0AAD4QRH4_9BILA|nr:hypothetical protein DdX_21216 [Ditylenchus destructor]
MNVRGVPQEFLSSEPRIAASDATGDGKVGQKNGPNIVIKIKSKAEFEGLLEHCDARNKNLRQFYREEVKPHAFTGNGFNNKGGNNGGYSQQYGNGARFGQRFGGAGGPGPSTGF